MHRRHTPRWIAIAGFSLVLATACQAPAPTSSAQQPPGASTAKAVEPDPGAAPKAYAVQARPFKMPDRIWRRGKRKLVPPPAPLPLQRKLLADAGYPVTTVWPSQLYNDTVPCDIAFDKDQNAYVANVQFETNVGRILKVTPASAVSLFSTLTGNAISADPTGTKLAAASLYFDLAENPNWEEAPLTNQLATFTLPSAVPTFSFNIPGDWDDPIPDSPVPFSSLTLGTLYDVAYDNAGNILIADGDEHHQAIRAIHPTTHVTSMVARLTNERGESVTSIFVGPTGTIYCALGNQIWLIPPGGAPRVLAGSLEEGFADGPAGAARFRWPQKLVYGGDGYLYVADQGNCAIRRVSLDGQVTTIAGNGEAGDADGVGPAARFSFPLGLRYGPDGNLYVADSFNYRIRKIQLAGDAGFSVSDPAKPSDTSGAFSPNGDGSKDTLNLHVTATSPWMIVTTDGAGNEVTVKEGEGTPEPQTLNWDGRVNGITLPDGKYTLRLKSGEQEKTAEVTIDNTPPKIVDLSFKKLFPDDISSLDYTITANLEDELSGIDQNSIKIDISGGTTASPLLNFNQDSGSLNYAVNISPQVAYRLLAASQPGEILSVTTVGDRAGNISKEEQFLDQTFISEVLFDRNRVRPLGFGEKNYGRYADAVVQVRITAGGQKKAGANIHVTSERVANTGGHLESAGSAASKHPNGPTGAFSLTKSFSSNQLNPSHVEGEIDVKADSNGIATLYYRPYGFSGQETIAAEIKGKPGTRLPETLSIGLDGFVSINPGQFGYLEFDLTSSVSHADGYYARTDFAPNIEQFLRNYNQGRQRDRFITRGRRLVVTAGSLPEGGPYEIRRNWRADQGRHAGHRDGREADIGTTLVSGVRIPWADPVTNFYLQNSNLTVLDEGDPSHWHVYRDDLGPY